MTGEQAVQLVTALVPAILAFFAVVGSVVTAFLSYKTNRKVEKVSDETTAQTSTINAAAVIAASNSKKSDEIIIKAEQIHTLTNSNLSAVTAALEKLKAASDAEIKELRASIQQLLDDKKETAGIASKLADRAIPTHMSDATPPQPPQPPALGTQRTITDANVKLKEDIIIEGTLETKKE